jgi:uncharacterized membrane protein (DUF106 family)
MNMLLVEFLGVIFVYMTIVNFVMKKVGGAELKVLESDIKKHLESAKKGDKDALKKLNELNSKRMKMSMKAQLYLMPIIIPALFFIKWRYAALQWVLFGRTFGWLGAFFILGIPISMISEKIVRKVLKYS